jgi:hypothetical protein
VQPSGAKGPTYGVAEIQADTYADTNSHTVSVNNARRELRFPAAAPEETARLAAVVDRLVPVRQSLVVPLDLVLAYVRSGPARQREVEVSLAPGRLLQSESRDPRDVHGRAHAQAHRGTKLMFAINTNWDVLYDAQTSRYFLLDEESWLTASDPVKGPWTPTQSLPTSFAALPRDPRWDEVRKHLPGRPHKVVPVVFATTAPAEMIEGAPAYGPVPGTRLLYVSNTSSVVLLHTGEKQYY